MSNPKIVVVEDENIVALDLKNQLEKNNYTVQAIYSSGEAVLEDIPSLSPDLVLMDIKLQGKMDGVETARSIRNCYKIPVVFITAFADETTFERAKNIDPFGYIIKPFEERILRTTIEMALYKAKIDKKLIESEERYRNFFEEDLSGDFVADKDGKLQECNSAFMRMFSFDSRKAALRTNINQLFNSKEDRDHFWKRLRKNKKLQLMELTLKKDSYENIDVLANVIGTFNEEELLEIKGYLIDTTERKKLEEQLRQSQKMEAIGRLAGGIAHDFNNILTVILGYSTMMNEKIKEGDPVDQDIEGIQKAAKKAVNLTRQLLVFSRKHTLKPRLVEINKLITDMEKMLRRLIHENISMNLFFDSGNSFVFIDPGQMEQVLINLAVNAKDAMPNGGKLLIKTGSYYPDENEKKMKELDGDGYVNITIQDTGIGIEKKYLSKIFEPFFTTKAEEQGTGLGLSTVYAIITQSGGRIEVQSEVDKGTLFSLYLPKVEKPKDISTFSMDKQNEALGTETILVVEDDDNVRELIIKVLSRKGYQLLEAKNAGEALLHFEKHEENIHMLITDIVLPLMSGEELAERLQKNQPSVKILFISGYSDKALRPQGNSPVTDFSFIQKPFEIEYFTNKVREILDS